MTDSVLIGNLFAYACQVAFLVIIGVSLPRVLGLRAPRITLVLYQGLLLACLLLPLLQPWVRSIDPLPALVASETLFTAEPEGPLPGPPVMTRPRVKTQVATEETAYSTEKLVLLILGAGILIRLFWLGFGLWRIKVFLRNSHLLSRVPLPLGEMQALLHVYPHFYLSPRLKSPVSFGLSRPVIIFPQRFMKMDKAGQAAVACHELLHIRRRDWISILWEEIVCSILWFHPAIWWLTRESRLVREQVIDQQVVAITRNWRSYVHTLIEMATNAEQAREILATSFSRPSQLVRRLELIISAPQPSRLRIAVSLFGIVGALFLTGFVSVSRLPLTSSLGPPVPIESQVLVNHLVRKVEPVYPEGADSVLDRDLVLRVQVDQDGIVVRAEPLSGHLRLGLAASKAVTAWRFRPVEVGHQKLPVVGQLRLRFRSGGEIEIISRSVLNLVMDELGKLRSVSDSALSEEEIVQHVIESQPSTHIYISEDTPFDVVQEKVRLLEQLGAANVQLSPGTIALLDEQPYFTPDLKALQSPGIAPEDLRDLQQQARLLLKDSGAFLFRIFSDATGQIVSVEHRAGPRSIEIESQLLKLKVAPGRLGVDPVPVAFLLRLEPFHEGRAPTPQLALPESSTRLFAFREGQLFYTHRMEGILPPQVELDYLSKVADQARNYLDFPIALQFRLFCDETGRVVSIERLGGTRLPQIEANLSRAVVSPGTLEGTPVPVVFLLNLALDEPQLESVAATDSEWTYDEFMRQDWRTWKVVLGSLPWEKASELKRTHVRRYLDRDSFVLDENQLRLIGDYLTYLRAKSPEHPVSKENFREEVRRYFSDRESRSIFSLNGDPIPK